MGPSKRAWGHVGRSGSHGLERRLSAPCHLAPGVLTPRSGQGLLSPRPTGSISHPAPLQSLGCPFYKQTHILPANRLYLHTYTSTHRCPTLWLAILGRRQELVSTEPASSQQMRGPAELQRAPGTASRHFGTILSKKASITVIHINQQENSLLHVPT